MIVSHNTCIIIFWLECAHVYPLYNQIISLKIATHIPYIQSIQDHFSERHGNCRTFASSIEHVAKMGQNRKIHSACLPCILQLGTGRNMLSTQTQQENCEIEKLYSFNLCSNQGLQYVFAGRKTGRTKEWKLFEYERTLKLCPGANKQQIHLFTSIPTYK